MSSKSTFPAAGVPRIIPPTFRIPPGSDLRRFKVRADGPTAGPTRYILARSKEQAEQEYHRVRESGEQDAAVSNLIVTELAD